MTRGSHYKAKLFQVAPGLLSGCRLDCPILFYVSTRFHEFQVKAAVLALLDFKHSGTESIKVVKHEGQSVSSRAHLSLCKDAPEPRAKQPPECGPVIEIAEVGGLHHRYERRAA
jgi:hypothetical protein